LAFSPSEKTACLFPSNKYITDMLFFVKVLFVFFSYFFEKKKLRPERFWKEFF